MSYLLKVLSNKYATSFAFNQIKPLLVHINRNFCEKIEVQPTSDGKGGFAQAYDKHTADLKEPEPKKDIRTFATLLRNSKFIDVSFQHPFRVIGLFMKFLFSVGRSREQNCHRPNISHCGGRFVRRLWLEVPLCGAKANEKL